MSTVTTRSLTGIGERRPLVAHRRARQHSAGWRLPSGLRRGRRRCGAAVASDQLTQCRRALPAQSLPGSRRPAGKGISSAISAQAGVIPVIRAPGVLCRDQACGRGLVRRAVQGGRAPLGIKVTCVEPGPVPHRLAGRSLQQRRPADCRLSGDGFSAKARATKSSYSGQQPGDPARGPRRRSSSRQAKDPRATSCWERWCWMEFWETDRDAVRDQAWAETSRGADYPESDR